MASSLNVNHFHIPVSWVDLLNGYDFYFRWRDTANQSLCSIHWSTELFNSSYRSYQRFDIQTRRRSQFCFVFTLSPCLCAALDKGIFDTFSFSIFYLIVLFLLLLGESPKETLPSSIVYFIGNTSLNYPRTGNSIPKLTSTRAFWCSSDKVVFRYKRISLSIGGQIIKRTWKWLQPLFKDILWKKKVSFERTMNIQIISVQNRVRILHSTWNSG